MAAVTESLPGRFAAFLGPDHVCQPALQWFKLLLSQLEFLDGAAHTDAQVRGFLHDFILPSMPWVREILVGLAEADFAQVLAQTKRSVEAWALGMDGTYINELLVNYLKGKDTTTHRARLMAKAQAAAVCCGKQALGRV